MSRDICLVGAGNKEAGPRYCSVVSSDRTRASDHKPKCKKLNLRIRRHFFTLRVVKSLNRLLSEVVKSVFLKKFKQRQETILSNLI